MPFRELARAVKPEAWLRGIGPGLSINGSWRGLTL
jgi:hypothetical protein